MTAMIARPIIKNLRSAALAILLVPALLSSAPSPAVAALEFHCIEASRYKNLLPDLS